MALGASGPVHGLPLAHDGVHPRRTRHGLAVSAAPLAEFLGPGVTLTDRRTSEARGLSGTDFPAPGRGPIAGVVEEVSTSSPLRGGHSGNGVKRLLSLADSGGVG